MYTVVFQSNETPYESRSEAIEAAKAFSSESYERAQVLGEDGREVMVYRDGGLEDYVYETRRRRAGGDDDRRREKKDEERRNASDDSDDDDDDDDDDDSSDDKE